MKITFNIWRNKFLSLKYFLPLLFLFGNGYDIGAYEKKFDTPFTHTLISEADAFTMQSMPNNYNNNPDMHHNGWWGGIRCRNYSDNYKYKGYVRFNLVGIPSNSITEAILRLYHPRTGTNSLVVSPVDNDSWTEQGINWNNAPLPGATLSTQPITTDWNEIDVTSFVQNQTDGKVSFNLNILDPQYKSIYFISREGRTDWRPQLVITHTSGVIPPPEPPATSTSSLLFNSIWLVHSGIWTQYISAQTACDNAVSGDEVVFGPGRYYQTFDVKSKSNITIRGDGTPRPILDASGITERLAGYGRGLIGLGRVSSERVEDITIENLEIKDASSICGFEGNASSIYVVYATNTTVRNCYIHHNGNGIFVTNVAFNYTQESCEVANNSYVGSGYEHGHYFEADGTTTTRYNHIHRNGGQGYKDRGQNTILAYNYIYDNGNYEIDFSKASKFTKPQNALIIGNIIKKPADAVNNSQIITFGEDRHGGIGTFVNNTIIAGKSTNRFFNIWGSNANDRIVAHNNIFHSNGFANLAIEYDSTDQYRLSGKNNWLRSDAKNIGSLTNSVFGIDPNLVDVGGEDFHLLSTSQCINTGSNNITPLPDKEYLHPRNFSQRGINGNIDIGAYEYNEISRSPSKIIITKQADKTTVNNGGTITYTITYTNVGSSTTTDVVIIEVLPENMELSIVHSPLSIVSYWYDNAWQSQFSNRATKIRWVIPEVVPGKEGTVSFTVKVKYAN